MQQIISAPARRKHTKVIVQALTAALLALSLSSLALTPSQAAGASERESNDTFATATAIKLGTTYSGTSKGAHGDEDYFAVDIPSAGRAKINLKFPTLPRGTEAYELGVYNSAGEELYNFNLDTSQGNGLEVAAQGTFLPKGRSYIRIYGDATWKTWGKSYTLNVSHAAGTVETEVNNSIDTADVIKLGTTYSGSMLRALSRFGATIADDTDVFAVDIPSNGRTKFEIKLPALRGGDHAYDVSILDAAENELYKYTIPANQFSGASLASQATFLPKGRAFIAINSDDRSNAWGKTYTLKVSHTPGNVESEINDDAEAADAIKLGTSYSGSALRAGSSDNDYFAVNMPARGRAELSFKFPGNLRGDDIYRVEVYNAQDQEIVSYDLSASHSTGTWLAKQPLTLDKGTSYVKISAMDHKASWGKQYALKVSALLSGAPTPKISGTAKVGSTLTAKTGSWNPSGVALKYQWKRNGSSIKGATKSTYKITTADAGKKLTLAVTGTKSGYKTVTKTSSAAIVPLLNLSAAPTPKISGTAKVGSTLTAKAGIWKPSGVALKYQWKRNGSTIKGATRSAYKITTADAGKKLTLAVTGTKSGYKTVTKTSTAKLIGK